MVNTCECLFLKFLSALPSNKLEITGVLVNIYTYTYIHILLLLCNSLYKRVEHSENTLTIFTAPPTLPSQKLKFLLCAVCGS